MRYILKVSYCGENYSGFQIQNNKTTIQLELEKALSEALKEDIKIVASGRTDAGVSAIEQVCHFDIDKALDKNIVGYLNVLLPEDIRVLSIEHTSDDFHARYLAKQKTYEYYFYVGNCIPVYERFAVNIGYNIDVTKMQEACKYLVGEYDFTSFCASNTSVQDKVRTIYDASISQIDDNLYKLVIIGNGFLYNMVRIVMGTLVDIGLNKISPKEIVEIINSKNRAKAGKTMPANGLYLKKVIY